MLLQHFRLQKRIHSENIELDTFLMEKKHVKYFYSKVRTISTNFLLLNQICFTFIHRNEVYCRLAKKISCYGFRFQID